MDGSHVAPHEMHKAGRWWLCVQSRPGSSHCNWTWISAGAVQRLDSQGRLLNPDPSLRSRKFHDRDSMKGMFLTPSTADLPMPLLCCSRCREALIPFSPPPPHTHTAFPPHHVYLSTPGAQPLQSRLRSCEPPRYQTLGKALVTNCLI